MSNSLWPHKLQSAGFLCPWDSPGRSTGVGCYALFQELFLTRGSNPRILCLLHCQVGSLPLAPPGKLSTAPSVQFSSVQLLSSVWLCDPKDCSIPGLPVHHQLLGLVQTHVHWVGDAIQPSHPLLSPSPPAFNLSQHQGFFQWVSSLHQVILKFQLQDQSFQWIFRTDFL